MSTQAPAATTTSTLPKVHHRKGKPSPNRGKVKVFHDWDRLKADYFQKNRERQPDEPKYMLMDLAKDNNMSYATLRVVAGRQKWDMELAATLVSRDGVFELKEALKGELAIDTLAQEQINQEVNVRQRHATFARMMQSKALVRLQLMDPEEMKPRDAIELLRISLDVEREALGIPKAGTLDSAAAGKKSYASVAQAVTEQEQLRELGLKFLKHLANKRGATEGETIPVAQAIVTI